MSKILYKSGRRVLKVMDLEKEECIIEVTSEDFFCQKVLCFTNIKG